MKEKTLDITHTELIDEWSDKNKIKPNEVTHGSHKKIWWKCKKGHEWKVSANQRSFYKTNCPYCSNQKVCKDNCLATTHPFILNKWHFNKNILDPTNITFGSTKKVWWKCDKCKQEWKTSINYQLNNNYCPFCKNIKLHEGNALKYTHPELVEEIFYKNIDPTKIKFNSNKKIKWKCKNCQQLWKAKVSHRTNGSGCPYCAGKKICKTNSLAFKYPKLIKEWNCKNSILPTEVSSGSSKSVWWRCKEGNEWKSKISERSLKKRKCPYCSNQKVCKDNCLATTHSEITKEWSKKNDIKPTEVVAGSNKKVWWICLICNYEWKASIKHRSRSKSNCPKCKFSKGEKEIFKILEKLNIRYQCQYKFKKINKYSFDFAIFKKYARKPYAVIEYHGKQHYEVVDFSGRNIKRAEKEFKQIKKRDQLKKQFCKNNNIKLIEIKYTDFNNIEQILNEAFNQISNSIKT